MFHSHDDEHNSAVCQYYGFYSALSPMKDFDRCGNLQYNQPLSTEAESSYTAPSTLVDISSPDMIGTYPDYSALEKMLYYGQGAEFLVGYWSSAILAKAACSGWIVISAEIYNKLYRVLILNLYKFRCIIRTGHARFSKKILKTANRYTLAICRELIPDVVEGCKVHHEKTKSWVSSSFGSLLEEVAKDTEASWTRKTDGAYCIPVGVILYDGTHPVAGDLGYFTGKIYTSLSGFHNKSGMGTIMLAKLSLFLEDNGFAIWDLGQVFKYKLDMGAQIVRTDTWLRMVEKYGQSPTPNAKFLIQGGIYSPAHGDPGCTFSSGLALRDDIAPNHQYTQDHIP